MSGKKPKTENIEELERCPLCGKSLPPEPSQRIVGATGRSICMPCLRAASIVGDLDIELEPKKETEGFLNLTPSEVICQLDEAIIAQSDAKRAVVTALWKQIRRRNGDSIPNASLLLYGPTGCGKTALVREAARIMGIPFVSADATSISETGYKGRDASDIVRDLVRVCGSVEKAAYGVVFIDEVDKLAAVPGNEYRAAFCRGTQFSFLKLIEGTDVNVDDDEVINTSNILFLFGGAFSKLTDKRKSVCEHKTVGFLREPEMKSEDTSKQLLPEDFVAFGMEPEFMGRVGRCVALSLLTEESMLKILLESRLSSYRKYQDYFLGKGKQLAMREDEARDLVQKALSRGMGARGLSALVEEWIEPRLMELADSEEYRGELGA